jgi:beta-glucosidase
LGNLLLSIFRILTRKTRTRLLFICNFYTFGHFTFFCMNRSEFLKSISASMARLLASPWFIKALEADPALARKMFGESFLWGVTTAAFQTEGAYNADGKGESIWDRFSHIPGKIKDNSNADVACNFYNLYQEDIDLLKSLHFGNFRFSIAWSRIFPEGTGTVNPKGIDYYNRVIDYCLEAGIRPWLTLYHWDLPQALQDKGGWPNRDIVGWFTEYADLCTRKFGDRVKDWVVLNEPAAFTTFGYLTGLHAPGQRGLNKYLASVHHAALCQAEGGRIVRANVENAHTGTSLSCSYVEPYKQKPRHEKAAKRIDVMLNRLFIEPLLGMGYPMGDMPFLEKLEKFFQPGDEDKLKFDFDFIGLQNYFRVIGKWGLIPILWANQVKPDEKVSEVTALGWEVWPEGIYHIIKQFAKYPIKEIIVTENGAAFPDEITGKTIHDTQRAGYFKEYLKNVLRAKKEGINVTGYFVWTLTDNFEWTFGNIPRFGIIYNDFHTQQRTVKDSGLWFREFLR